MKPDFYMIEGLKYELTNYQANWKAWLDYVLNHHIPKNHHLTDWEPPYYECAFCDNVTTNIIMKEFAVCSDHEEPWAHWRY